MDFIDKAKIRLERWITHNDQHQEEYRAFAEQLEQEGAKESALLVQEMTDLTAKGTDCLRRALKAID